MKKTTLHEKKNFLLHMMKFQNDDIKLKIIKLNTFTHFRNNQNDFEESYMPIKFI